MSSGIIQLLSRIESRIIAAIRGKHLPARGISLGNEITEESQGRGTRGDSFRRTRSFQFQSQRRLVMVTSDLSTHLGEWLFLGDVSILGCFLAARLSLVLLAEADRPEGPLFLLEANKRAR